MTMHDSTQIQPYSDAEVVKDDALPFAPGYVIPTPKPQVETGPSRHPTRAQAYLLFLIVLVLNAIGQTVISTLGLGFPIEVTLSEVLFILVPVLAFLQIGNFDMRATLHLNPTTPRMVLLSMGVALLAWPIGEVLGYVTDLILSNVGPLPSPVPNPSSALEAISYLFVLTIVPGICEETLNRGVMQRAFERQGLWRTVFYIGIFFSLFHLALYTLLFTFVLGSILSYVVFKTNSIYNSMVCHAVFNSVTAVLIVLTYFGQIPADFEDMSWLLPLAAIALPLLLGLLYYIGQLTRAENGAIVYVAPVDNSLVKGRFSFAEMALLTVIAVIFLVMCSAELGLRYICSHPELWHQLRISASVCQQ